jgi:16S rRNA processing protein RimM
MTDGARPPRFAERRRAATGAPSRRAPAPEAPARVDPEDLVFVGATLGPIGIRGEIRVKTFTAEPEGLCAYGPLYGEDGARLLTPERWRVVKEGLALTARELPDRNAAEALGRPRLFVPRTVLPPAEEEEFYHIDLVGCAVESVEGAALGRVVAVQDFGAGDILQIEGPSGTLFIEFTKAAAPLVDVRAKRIVVVRPEVAEPLDDAKSPS